MSWKLFLCGCFDFNCGDKEHMHIYMQTFTCIHVTCEIHSLTSAAYTHMYAKICTHILELLLLRQIILWLLSILVLIHFKPNKNMTFYAKQKCLLKSILEDNQCSTSWNCVAVLCFLFPMVKDIRISSWKEKSDGTGKGRSI